ncbi:14739_t:CDS:2 [Acaulospora colombiana]|uniref:14739_t:CDS:1 n=1 Tax=Acaulospora colombiana TaxID=27376 RepID=A0ACA9K508_9GLOM|nr:14739_t:CDS:2 [Acaulospora colombiana]
MSGSYDRSVPIAHIYVISIRKSIATRTIADTLFTFFKFFHRSPIQNAEYVVVAGARRKVETWEPEDTETIELKDEEEAKRLADNAFYKLEQSVKDEQKAKESLPILTQLQRLNDRQWADPYTHSQKMRKKFREEKKITEAKKRADDEIRDRNSLSIPLLPESQEDLAEAKATEFKDHLLRAQKRKLEINTSSIFNKSSKSKKRSIFRTDDPKNKVAQLSAMVSVNTKLKIDPFLKNNDWNSDNLGKGGDTNKELTFVRKKEDGKKVEDNESKAQKTLGINRQNTSPSEATISSQSNL